ncbi:hypothetical protein GCM10020221_20050 [Streptomyces thioluteus]|uniref:Uncharacterized protein n=1 Tax=Streptomyces thioluteus TaxID=66431 RepID=A0ABP6J851_STRTU
MLALGAGGRGRPADLGDAGPQAAGRAQGGDREELVAPAAYRNSSWAQASSMPRPGVGEGAQVGDAGGQRAAELLAAEPPASWYGRASTTRARTPVAVLQARGGEGGDVGTGGRAGAGEGAERVGAEVAAGLGAGGAALVVQAQQGPRGGLGVVTRVEDDGGEVEEDAVQGRSDALDGEAGGADGQPEGG